MFHFSPFMYVYQRKMKAGLGFGQKPAIFRDPKRRSTGMTLTKRHLAMVRSLGVAAVTAVALASCASYDDDFARMNSRLDQLDSRVQGAAQSAEAANQSAQQANQRLDQLENRVRQLETAPTRTPRG